MQISIPATAQENAIVRNAARILARELSDKGGISIQAGDDAGADKIITLQIDPLLGPEVFQIISGESNLVISGGDGPGVVYGCGRFLRKCRLGRETFEFPESEGPSAPAKPWRGMYFCTHNYNYYQIAPMPEVATYIEQLALWGINAICVLYHKFHYQGFDDPKAQEYAERLKNIFEVGKSVGMKSVLLMTANDGYLNSPEELRYDGNVARNWGTELCPSKPAGLEAIKKEYIEVFEYFENLDAFVIWPYDSGGCLCDGCRPWGVNGYPRLAKEVAKLFKERHPHGAFVLGAWYFDYNLGHNGEWDALFENLEKDWEWVDMVLADGTWVNGGFPHEVLERPIHRPVISFLEISMRTGDPWGGFGANPMPAYIAQQWDLEKNLVQGGIPYSEGIFEDINKVIWAQLCWDPERAVHDIIEEYALFEFACPEKYARRMADAIMLLEKACPHRFRGKKSPGWPGVDLSCYDFVDEAWETISYLERSLPISARQRWRWRQVFLRALIDSERKAQGGKPTPAIGRAHDELERMYYYVNDLTYPDVRPTRIVIDEAAADLRLKEVSVGKSLGHYCQYPKKMRMKYMSKLTE